MHINVSKIVNVEGKNPSYFIYIVDRLPIGIGQLGLEPSYSEAFLSHMVLYDVTAFRSGKIKITLRVPRAFK